MNRSSLANMAVFRWTLGLLVAFFHQTSAQGFVLLSGPKEARLPITPEEPEITFFWDGRSPELDKKEELENSDYDGLDDVAFTGTLLREAMAHWNNVIGSYAVLRVQTDSHQATIDPADAVFSIVTDSDISATAAAFAAPSFSDDGKIIEDCDIVLADRKTNAKGLLYTLVHELGHCLGLGHAHSNYGAIMGYARSGENVRLGADDMAGVSYLYPDPAIIQGDPNQLPLCGSIYGTKFNSGKKSIPWVILMLCLPWLIAVLPYDFRKMKRWKCR